MRRPLFTVFVGGALVVNLTLAVLVGMPGAYASVKGYFGAACTNAQNCPNCIAFNGPDPYFCKTVSQRRCYVGKGKNAKGLSWRGCLWTGKQSDYCSGFSPTGSEYSCNDVDSWNCGCADVLNNDCTLTGCACTGTPDFTDGTYYIFYLCSPPV